MEPVSVSGLPLNEKYVGRLCAEIRYQEDLLQQANSLLDSILICLNAHLHDLCGHPLDDTVQAISHEIDRYKGCSEYSVGALENERINKEFDRYDS